MKELNRSFIDQNYQTWLGMRLLNHRPGFAQLELPVRSEFLNVSGTVHGGVVASVADCALGCAILSDLAPGMTCASIEIKSSLCVTVRCVSMPVSSAVESVSE